jgi:hypothetical protein
MGFTHEHLQFKEQEIIGHCTNDGDIDWRG